jgi:hypothetical protein
MAGLRAADKLLHMAMIAGLEVKFYILPKGENPDSFSENKIKMSLHFSNPAYPP